MNEIAIIGFCFWLIVIEALTDGLDYLGWRKANIYGTYAHITQVVLLLSYFVFGSLWTWPLISTHTLVLGIGYICMRFGLFDWLYFQITGNEQGSTALFDKLTKKLPILNNMIIRLIATFAGMIVLTLS